MLGVFPTCDGPLRPEGRRLNWLCPLYRSTMGKKFVMAVTGFIGFAYVVLHMLGNLQVFEGPAKLNAYAAFLKSNGVLLWSVRVILLGALILHMLVASQLARIRWRSRPIRYHRWQPVGSDYASRTMRWSGPIIGLFILYHLLHLTTGTVHPHFQPGDVYENVVMGFRVWYVSAFYIAAMFAVGLHMSHGVWSMFQSLGVNHQAFNGLIRTSVTSVTLAVIIGFVAIPVGVLLGIVS
jgi:succinate dehydrogenase / fumarate reductase cytochrome b subunit